jgi:ferredoxin
MTTDNVEINFRPAGAVQTTSLVAYESRGHCLVISELEAGLELIAKLNVKAATLLVNKPGAGTVDKQATEDGVKVITANVLLLNGHLGAFDCAVGPADDPGSLAKLAGVSLLGGFDTVLDMSAEPLLSHEVLPFGYYAPHNDPAALERALAEIPELEGEFEKPKYFAYDSSICAHSRSGITACSNCIDVCGTGAIKSDGEGISVEPYLCQGCGSCSSSCPSGAITYAYPRPADAMTQLAGLLADHYAKHRTHALVFLHDAEHGAEHVAGFSAQLDASVLPVAVEEVASVGMDGWFSALAYGAAAVVIDSPDAEKNMTRALAAQISTANDILDGLGLSDSLVMIDDVNAEKLNTLAASHTDTVREVATFKTFNDKRQTIRMAVDHLRRHASVVEEVSLSGSAPFGKVNVDTQACITVCPARALQDGETLPQLKFIESNCLQCGMCEQACPENAISLTARYLYDSEQALKPAIVNEEKPFNCVVCNKPFATERIIGRMMTKLSGHWMFEDDKAKRRLKMCEDCRVMDIFKDEQGIDVHKS